MSNPNPFQNPYQSPNSELQTAQHDSGMFFQVGATKCFVMCLGTFGLYILFWMYQHWAKIKARTNADVWPIARAIFSIFFYHSLTKRAEDHADSQRIALDWNREGLANGVVALLLMSRFADRVIPGKAGMALSFLSFAVIAYLHMLIQKGLNAANGTPNPENAAFTPLNIVALVLGGLLWLMIIFMLAMVPEAELMAE